jgi:hypothetical protein
MVTIEYTLEQKVAAYLEEYNLALEMCIAEDACDGVEWDTNECLHQCADWLQRD